MGRLAGQGRRARDNALILHVKSGLSPEKTLLLRTCLVVVLIAVVVAIFWFDRDGLKDQIDGEITFTDILYFGMITVILLLH
jgi:voltage-gated potassium channel